MDTAKGFLTHRSVVRMAIVLSIKLFQFHLVHIHTFHFNFCSLSDKPLYAEREIVHFTFFQALTNLIRNFILFDIAENMNQRNLNEFVWLMLLFNICLNIPRDKINNVPSYDHT